MADDQMKDLFGDSEDEDNEPVQQQQNELEDEDAPGPSQQGARADFKAVFGSDDEDEDLGAAPQQQEEDDDERPGSRWAWQQHRLALAACRAFNQLSGHLSLLHRARLCGCC